MFYNVLSESFLHLPLWSIFRQLHPNFRGGRNANASEIWAQLTKNLLTKSGTERFRENIIPFLLWKYCHLYLSVTHFLFSIARIPCTSSSTIGLFISLSSSAPYVLFYYHTCVDRPGLLYRKCSRFPEALHFHKKHLEES